MKRWNGVGEGFSDVVWGGGDIVNYERKKPYFVGGLYKGVGLCVV